MQNPEVLPPITEAPAGPTNSAWSRPPPGETPLVVPVAKMTPTPIPTFVLCCLLASIVGSMGFSIWGLFSLGKTFDQNIAAVQKELKATDDKVEKAVKEVLELRQDLSEVRNKQAQRTTNVERIPDMAVSLMRLELKLAELVPTIKTMETQIQNNRDNLAKGQTRDGELKNEIALLQKSLADLTYVKNPKVPLPQEPSRD